MALAGFTVVFRSARYSGALQAERFGNTVGRPAADGHDGGARVNFDSLFPSTVASGVALRQAAAVDVFRLGGNCIDQQTGRQRGFITQDLFSAYCGPDCCGGCASGGFCHRFFRTDRPDGIFSCVGNLAAGTGAPAGHINDPCGTGGGGADGRAIDRLP